MGREAFVQATYDGRSGEAKAVLESQGIILRSPLSLTLPRDAIAGLKVEGDALVGLGPRGPFELFLGAAEAGRWKGSLEKPLPTLAEKLGLKPGVTIWTSGDLGAPELAEALAGVPRTTVEAASMIVIHAAEPNALAQALEASSGSLAPVWVIHGKGRTATFGESAVRALMRDSGFIDTKVSAVSDALSATRYARR